MADQSSPTHAAPRITEESFARALIEGPRTFTGAADAPGAWRAFLAHGVDPSFALGHFWRESLFGTAGWNLWVDLKSWGNVLWVNCQVKDVPGVVEYRASNGYEYAKYPDWATGAEDVARLLDDYRDHPDRRYGDTSLIYGAVAKWAAMPVGSDEHLAYFNNVISRMNRYDSAPPQEGEMAISAPGIKLDSDTGYWIKKGDPYYIVPGQPSAGKFSFGTRSAAVLKYFGRVVGTDWAAVLTTTAAWTPASEPALVYVPYVASRVIRP